MPIREVIFIFTLFDFTLIEMYEYRNNMKLDVHK